MEEKACVNKATQAQLERLLADIRAIPDQPVGDHLTEEQFIGYAVDSLTAEEQSVVETHVISCDDCAEQMERLCEADTHIV